MATRRAKSVGPKPFDGLAVDPKDKRWRKDCSYCWICLRHQYPYDWAKKHQFCPTCKDRAHKAKKEKEVVQVKVEKCPIRLPQSGEPGKLRRLIVAGEVPFKLRNAKWKELREWAENTREHFREKGLFLTVGGIVNLAYRAGLNYDRSAKAAVRLQALYAPEWEQWRIGVARDIDEAIERERREFARRAEMLGEKRKTGIKDDLGRREKKVLAVLGRKPMTVKEIRKAARMAKVIKPLKRLVSLGLASKTDLGNYSLPREGKKKRRRRIRKSR